MTVKLKCRCVVCDHIEVLTDKQLEEAKEDGCPCCSECLGPMILEEATAREVRT